MNRVTAEDIQKINELYLELHTYAAVARKTGFAATTVKKYIIPSFKKIEEKNIKKFEGELPDFDASPFYSNNWSSLCIITNKEREELKSLWQEILI